MLHVAFLFLSWAAAQDVPTLTAELKDIPAKGTERPVILCEGTATVPDGAVLNTWIYFEKIIEGREIWRDTVIVKGGKFSRDFPLYPKKNLSGKYIARITFNPALQGLAVGELPYARIDVPFQFGTAEDADRDSKAVREQLVGEIRFLLGLSDQVKAKVKELKGKPAAAWDPLVAQWREQTIELQRRTLTREVPEYKVLGLDTVADPGMENLCAIFLSAARAAALGQVESSAEGMTRLRQTADYWISEVSAPRLSDPVQILAHIEKIRTLLRDALKTADAPILPLRRKFMEMNSLLDKSVPPDFHVAILDLESRSVGLFNALADKLESAKDLQQDMDHALEKLAVAVRSIK